MAHTSVAAHPVRAKTRPASHDPGRENCNAILKRLGERSVEGDQKALASLLKLALGNEELGELAGVASAFEVPLWVMLMPGLPPEKLDKAFLRGLEKHVQSYLAVSQDAPLPERDVPASALQIEKILTHQAPALRVDPTLSSRQLALLNGVSVRLGVVNATLDMVYTLTATAEAGNMLEGLSDGTLNHAMWGAMKELEMVKEELDQVPVGTEQKDAA